MDQQRVIKGLGEIALRVNDLEKMSHFYEHVIGLEVWQRYGGGVFSASQKASLGILECLCCSIAVPATQYRHGPNPQPWITSRSRSLCRPTSQNGHGWRAWG